MQLGRLANTQDAETMPTAPEPASSRSLWASANTSSGIDAALFPAALRRSSMLGGPVPTAAAYAFSSLQSMGLVLGNCSQHKKHANGTRKRCKAENNVKNKNKGSGVHIRQGAEEWLGGLGFGAAGGSGDTSLVQ